MKKKLIFLLLLAASALTAQTSKLLVGKWDYVRTDLERAKKAGIEPSYSFKDFSLEFGSAGSFRTTELHRGITGSWSLSEDQRMINGEMETGRLFAIEIIELSGSELVIKYRNGFLVMKQVSKEEPAIKPFALPATVTAKAGEVTGRWKARQIFMENDQEVPRAEMPNIQFQFREDGRMGAFSQGSTEEGSWKLGNRNDNILASLHNEIIVFYVISVSPKELILKEGPGGITMVLARMP